MPSVFKSNIILLILKNNIELVIIFRRADREYTIMTGCAAVISKMGRENSGLRALHIAKCGILSRAVPT